MADKRNPKAVNDAAESTAPDLAGFENEAAASDPRELGSSTPSDPRPEDQEYFTQRLGDWLTPEIPEDDSDLLGMAEMVIYDGAPDGGRVPYDHKPTVLHAAERVYQDMQAVDVRTDGFVTLRFTKADWPVGLRLGTMPREDVRAVTGELGADGKGLIAWFLQLPGEVTFRDGSRVILRDDPTDGYVVDVK